MAEGIFSRTQYCPSPRPLESIPSMRRQFPKSQLLLQERIGCVRPEQLPSRYSWIGVRNAVIAQKPVRTALSCFIKRLGPRLFFPIRHRASSVKIFPASRPAARRRLFQSQTGTMCKWGWRSSCIAYAQRRRAVMHALRNVPPRPCQWISMGNDCSSQKNDALDVVSASRSVRRSTTTLRFA
jgi:hypothetical protein